MEHANDEAVSRTIH